MHKFFKIFILVLITLNLFFASWYVLHGDIHFHTDIARDFLLLDEIDQKKIVLLGPRSSTSGLFHGPLWLYLNYPAYVIGQGNPVIVGWFWILLITIFLGTSFIIAKKLFNEATAYLFVLLLATFLAFEAHGLFNPHGAFFLLPAFFFFFIRSLQTLKIQFLIAFFFTAGCIIQFQMAIGIPLLILGSIPLIYQIFKQKKFPYILSFLMLLIPLSTFILFELRHNFAQFHAILAYVVGDNLDTKHYGNAFGLVIDRVQHLTSLGIGLLKGTNDGIKFLLAIVLGVFLFLQLKTNKYKLLYVSFIYFYIGYYLLSLINKSGGMLYHYYMPLFPLVFLIFASFITSKYKKIFLVIVLFILFNNALSLKTHIDKAQAFIGHHQDSWNFLSSMTQRVFAGTENSLGYFIYMPDSLAYQPKYAIKYAHKQSGKHAEYFKKQPITYLVIAPPPPDKPGMLDAWWTTNQARITVKPQSIVTFPNGYKIEKYILDEAQQQIPFDPAIDTGIHFR